MALTIANDRVYSFGLGKSPLNMPILMGFPLNTMTPITPKGTRYDIGEITSVTDGIRVCYYSPTPILYANHGSLTLICGNEVRKTSQNRPTYLLVTGDRFKILYRSLLLIFFAHPSSFAAFRGVQLKQAHPL
jgi:hypothetical protein